jgi:hypothetical protein
MTRGIRSASGSNSVPARSTGAGRSGGALAPLLADLVAAEVHGEEAALLGDFRPTQFADATAPSAPSAARRPWEQ